MKTVVLVEGESDKCAVETLAARLGRDLAGDGVEVLAMGGATNIGHFVRGSGSEVQPLGLYDAGEQRIFQRALGEDDLERIGFFECNADLEDELIRALGFEKVEEVIASEGELTSFRKMQQQPAHRGSPVERQLRRFMGTHSGRKLQYARALVEALDLDDVPRPLAQLLAGVAA